AVAQPLGLSLRSPRLSDTEAWISCAYHCRVPSVSVYYMRFAVNDSQLFQIHEAKDRAQLTTTTALLVAHVVTITEEFTRRGTGRKRVLPAAAHSGLASSLFQARPRCLHCTRPPPITLRRSRCCDVGSYDKLPRWNQEETAEPSKHCCPCVCVSYRMADFEDEVSRRYDFVLRELIDAELQAARADTESESLAASIAQMRAQLGKRDSDNDELKARIKKAKAEKQKHEMKRRDRKTLTTMEDLLADRLHDLRMESLLKRLSFWQSVLNFVLYAVFLCNAFVTGLGAASGSTSAPASQP
ncbi:hypothetical protein NP493_7728g00006, partial [Ridgeia piscesae]